jgi:hypothetical protein
MTRAAASRKRSRIMKRPHRSGARAVASVCQELTGLTHGLNHPTPATRVAPAALPAPLSRALFVARSSAPRVAGPAGRWAADDYRI